MPTTMKEMARDWGVSVVTVSSHSTSACKPENGFCRMKESELPAKSSSANSRHGPQESDWTDCARSGLPFFAKVGKGISAKLRSQEYGLMISSSEDDPNMERREIDPMLARRVDALILASSQSTADGFRAVQDQRLPYILLDRKLPRHPENVVGVDDVAIGTLATSHLIEITVWGQGRQSWRFPWPNANRTPRPKLSSCQPGLSSLLRVRGR
jgi:LacI family transcriptional regulator